MKLLIIRGHAALDPHSIKYIAARDGNRLEVGFKGEIGTLLSWPEANTDEVKRVIAEWQTALDYRPPAPPLRSV